MTNGGFWGIAVEKGAKYLLRFYLRASRGYQGGLNAQLISADKKVVAEHGFNVKADGNWHEYTAKLRVSATDAKNNVHTGIRFARKSMGGLCIAVS